MNFNMMDFDMYSKKIGFFYQNKDRLGSRFGFCLTILYIFISLGLFIFYTSQTIRRATINVHDSTMHLKETSKVNIDPNLFYFAFGVENPETSTRFIDETIYYPKVTFFEKIKDGTSLKTVEEKELQVERCKQEKFGHKYQKLLVPGELNDSYCINDINLTLSRGIKNDIASYIKIGIHACVNTTDNNNHCKPKEVIDQHISGTFFSLLAKDIGLDPSNYSDPIIPSLQDLHTTIDKSFFKDFILYFGITEIQTDVGLFEEVIHRESYMNFIKTTQAFYYRDEKHFYDGETMCEIQFKLGDEIRVQKRSFMKMTEVFAITGGYMQLIMTIFKIITLLSNKLGYEIKMVNSLFNIYPENKKISLKYKLHKKFNDSPEKKQGFALYRTKNSSEFSPVSNNSEIKGIDRNSVNRLNINDYLIKSIHIHKNFNNIENQNKIYNFNNPLEDNKIQIDKKSKDSSVLSDNKNKSKINLLNLGINFNSININNRIQNQHSSSNNINKTCNIFEESCEIKSKSKSIEMNIFYYYCFSKCKNNRDDINLFDLAISFYKKKMDIIHLFYIILLIEKMSQNNNSNNKA